jgi:hypothetical protein
MKKSELRELVREIVGGYEPDGKGNLVRHNDKFDSTKLNSILKKIVDRDSEKDAVSEEATNVKNVDISYVYPGGRFYSVRVDGTKLPGFDASYDFIKDLTGLELPTRAYFDDKEVLDIVAALKAKGIEAGSSEMDVS